LDHFPKVRGENEKYLSCPHLVIYDPQKSRSFFCSTWMSQEVSKWLINGL